MTGPRNQIAAVLAVAFLLWTGGTAAALLYHPNSPYAPLGDDHVVPAQIHAGDRIEVVRNFVITRNAFMFLNRSMERLCGEEICEIKGLESGGLTLSKGEYHNLGRFQRIPADVTPGRWRLRFVLEYENLVGRRFVSLLPILFLEVLP